MFTVPLNNNMSVASSTAAVRDPPDFRVENFPCRSPRHAQSVVFGRCLAEWKNSVNWRLWHCGDGLVWVEWYFEIHFLSSVRFAAVRSFSLFLRRKKNLLTFLLYWNSRDLCTRPGKPQYAPLKGTPPNRVHA